MVVLTDSFTRLCNKKIPDWGYGDVYVRLYAKKSGNKIKYEIRTYENTSNKYNYAYSLNTYITLQGSKLMENGRLNAYAPNFYQAGKVNKDGEHVVKTFEQTAWGTEVVFYFKTYARDTEFTVTELVTRPESERYQDGTAVIYKSGFAADGVGQLRYKMKDGIAYITGGASGTFKTATYHEVTYEPLPAEYRLTTHLRTGASGITSGGAVVPSIAEFNSSGHIKLGFRNTAKKPNKIDFTMCFPV